MIDKVLLGRGRCFGELVVFKIEITNNNYSF